MDADWLAWRTKYAHEPSPWAGPVHAAPLLDELRGRVVELGAAGGKVDRVLPRDALAVDWVRDALPPTRPRIVADVRALPFREASVDALIAIHVLGHLRAADRERAVHEWTRVVRPGGALVLEVFAVGDARADTGREVEPGTRERGGILTHVFEEAELDGLLSGWDGFATREERALRWGVRRVLRGRWTRRE